MTALTRSAVRSRQRADDESLVMSRRQLAGRGIDSHRLRMQVRARRWQLLGGAVVLHNGPVQRAELERAALITCGPRSVLTSFSAAARWGLTGWDRPEVHVLVPAGTRRPDFPRLVMHRTSDWSAADIVPARRLHRPAAALVLATEGLSNPRYACALLAAGVQQRLVIAQTFHPALDRLPKLRHHRALRLAVHDIEQGAHALSEIDFVALCRRFGLPVPFQQAVRVEPSGRRRYLDALWRRADGSLLAGEVDGAIHRWPEKWMDDDLRQNEVVIAGIMHH
jgi:hypothetical protein